MKPLFFLGFFLYYLPSLEGSLPELTFASARGD